MRVKVKPRTLWHFMAFIPREEWWSNTHKIAFSTTYETNILYLGSAAHKLELRQTHTGYWILYVKSPTYMYWLTLHWRYISQNKVETPFVLKGIFFLLLLELPKNVKLALCKPIKNFEGYHFIWTSVGDFQLMTVSFRLCAAKTVTLCMWFRGSVD